MVTVSSTQLSSGDVERSLKLLDVAERAARSVEELLIGAFANGVATEEKSSFHDVVTHYDQESEHRIIEHILHQWPDSRICAEESGTRGSGSVEWYIDPIDGTNNFASGIPFFCVSIAAKVDGRLVAGVINDPVRGELFSASVAGAHLNGMPLVSSGSTHDKDCALVTSFPKHHTWPHRPTAVTSDLELYGSLVQTFRTVRRLGSCALSLAYVAAGRIDALFNVGVHPWDVAAGMLLVEQAGGMYRALGMPDGSEVEPWHQPDFIAHVEPFDLERSCLGVLVRP